MTDEIFYTQFVLDEIRDYEEILGRKLTGNDIYSRFPLEEIELAYDDIVWMHPNLKEESAGKSVMT